MDDLTAAELISRRITEGLSRQEQELLEQHLAGSAISNDFAQLSARIQEIIEVFRQTDRSASFGPGLDQVTQKRLERRLLEALDSIGWKEASPHSDGHTADQPGAPPSMAPDRRQVAEEKPGYGSDSVNPHPTDASDDGGDQGPSGGNRG